MVLQVCASFCKVSRHLFFRFVFFVFLLFYFKIFFIIIFRHFARTEPLLPGTLHEKQPRLFRYFATFLAFRKNINTTFAISEFTRTRTLTKIWGFVYFFFISLLILFFLNFILVYLFLTFSKLCDFPRQFARTNTSKIRFYFEVFRKRVRNKVYSQNKRSSQSEDNRKQRSEDNN